MTKTRAKTRRKSGQGRASADRRARAARDATGLEAVHKDLRAAIDELKTVTEEIKASRHRQHVVRATNERPESAQTDSGRLNALLRDSNDAVVLLDLEGRITGWNRGAERLYGYTEAEAHATQLEDLTSEGHRDLMKVLMRRISRGDVASQSLHTQRKTKDGRTRGIWATMTLLRNDEGQPDAIVSAERDVTEIKESLVARHEQAERALRRSESYLRSIVNTAADAIITIDAHGTIETFNPAAERMFGYVAAEVVGRNVSILMPLPYRNEHDGYIVRYLKTGGARAIGVRPEVSGLRKDGTTFPLDIAVSRMGNRHFAGILRDISDRRRFEWRTAESQLEERRHLAQELHDEIGGHMTGLGLLAQSLQAELAKRGEVPLAAKAQEVAQSISDAHQRLRSVVRGLMPPIEAGREGLITALRNLAEQYQNTSEVTCRFQCDPPVYVEDSMIALHLFRIAQEAVNNALRHGQPKLITVRLGRLAQHLELVVADDGRGLQEVPSGHAGIGLESVRQRVRLLGGECSIQSGEGGGTAVRCRVPLPDLLARGAGPRTAPSHERALS